MFKRLREDIDSIKQHDPAARSRFSVFLTYPGLHAVQWWRLSHWLWQRRWHTLALWMAYWARVFTGIEIHPGATIGRRLFIDHGTGVVIGETAEIGDDVTLYQGVTLGGTKLHHGKRHATLRNGVIVGAGAKVLGPIVVHDNARVGANAVVLKDVPEGVTVTGIPATVLKPRNRAEPPEFVAYGTPCDDLPDPVARSINSLIEEITSLRARVAELERESAHAGPERVGAKGNGAAERV